MRVLKTKHEVRAAVKSFRGTNRGERVGFVPTMGALHEGHLSLVKRAREDCGLVVLSIFVNPTQFAPGEDLERYPRALDRDLGLAVDAGVDLVFAPEMNEMYAPDHCTWVDVERVSDHLCGASRPGHFRGVATVVTKLFGIVDPDIAYLGQKDAQQALIIRRVTHDLDLDVSVEVCPTIRESDGLALSSRNAYLSADERRQAPVLWQALQTAAQAIEEGERDPQTLVDSFREMIEERASLAEVEYVEIVDTWDLAPVGSIEGEVVVAAAVRFGSTRLIDNVTAAPRR
jgi:pantoate--beta-alanine ligase